MPSQGIFPFVEYTNSTTKSTAKIVSVANFFRLTFQTSVYYQNFDRDNVYIEKKKNASYDVIKSRKNHSL